MEDRSQRDVEAVEDQTPSFIGLCHRDVCCCKWLSD